MKEKTKISATWALVILAFVASIAGFMYHVSQGLPSMLMAELYAPHLTCLRGDSSMVEAIYNGDKETFISYMVIGVLFVLWFAELRFQWHYRIFMLATGLFIWSCGIGHLFDMLSMYDGYYYYHKAITAQVTGKISMAVAIYGLCLIPIILKDINRIRETMQRLS